MATAAAAAAVAAATVEIYCSTIEEGDQLQQDRDHLV